LSIVGKSIRLSRIFDKKTGKAVVVTMDHGVDLGPIEGIEDFKATLRRVLGDVLPNAILLNPSMIKLNYLELAGKVGIIARLDGTTTAIGPDITDYRLFSSVKEALKLGADAVATMAFYGVSKESQNLEKIGKISQECEEWGMPQIVEALPPEILEHHFKSKAKWMWPKPEHVKLAARSAAELGADVVKSYYTGDPDTFKEVVKSCPVPILVLSGPGADDPEGLLQIVKDSIDAGASGVIMGRNIWGYKDPQAILRAIIEIVHKNASVNEAIKYLNK